MKTTPLRLIGLLQNFEEQSFALKVKLLESSACVVSERVLYEMPDHPQLLQEFTHQHDDVFVPGAELAKDVTVFEKRLKKVNSLTGFSKLFDDWQRFTDDAQNKMSSESWKFLNPVTLHLNTNDRNKMVTFLKRVPFPKTRDLLVKWASSYDGLPRQVDLDPRPALLSKTQNVKTVHSYQLH